MERDDQMEKNKRMSIGQFAKMTGVSQRTLRFYEEKGLLTPSYVSESGRRYYEIDDLIPLQQIMTFKYLGFPLDEIQSMMAVQTGSLRDSLLLQRQAMEQKRRQIDQIIKAIDHTVELLCEDDTIDAQVFSFLIQSIMTEQQQIEYLSEVFPERTVQHIKQMFADEERELAWNKRSAILFQRMKRAIDEHPPESAEVQALVGELMQMATEIFGDDWGALHAAAEQLEGAELPSYFSSPFSVEEEKKLMLACEIYMIEKGLIEDEG